METNLLDTLKVLQLSCLHSELDLRDELDLTQAEFDFFIASRKMSRLHCDLISEAMSLSASRVSRVVDGLVQKGLLVREIDTKDRRAIKISLSPKGRRVRSKIEDARCACEQSIKNNFTEGELTLITEHLKKIAGLISSKSV